MQGSDSTPRRIEPQTAMPNIILPPTSRLNDRYVTSESDYENRREARHSFSPTEIGTTFVDGASPGLGVGRVASWPADSFAGSSSRKRAPPPGAGSTPIEPPWASIANLQKVSPRPRLADTPHGSGRGPAKQSTIGCVQLQPGAQRRGSLAHGRRRQFTGTCRRIARHRP